MGAAGRAGEEKMKWFIGGLWLFALVVLIPLVMSEDPEIDAFVHCTVEVAARLKAPATADFPSVGGFSVVAEPADRYRVTSYVDAENSYGAKLRTPWTCEAVRDRAGRWHVQSVNLLAAG